MKNGEFMRVFGMSFEVDRAGKHKVGPIPRFFAQAHAKNLKLLDSVKPARRIAHGGSGLLRLDLVGDHFSFHAISFSARGAAIAHIFAFGKQRRFALWQPNLKVRMSVKIVDLETLNR